MHAVARLAPVRAVASPRVPGADGASQPIRRMTLSTVLADMRVPNSWDQAHARLPVAAPVRGALPYLPYHRLHVRPGHVRRARQVVVVRGFRHPGYPQEVVEPVSPPCEQSDDGASLASRDLDARRARSFSRYATFAFRYASSCSRVGSGFGLDFEPVPGHGLRLGQTVPSWSCRSRRGRAPRRPSSPSRSVCCRRLP